MVLMASSPCGGSTYKVTMRVQSQVGIHPDMAIDIAKLETPTNNTKQSGISLTALSSERAQNAMTARKF